MSSFVGPKCASTLRQSSVRGAMCTSQPRSAEVSPM